MLYKCRYENLKKASLFPQEKISEESEYKAAFVGVNAEKSKQIRRKDGAFGKGVSWGYLTNYKESFEDQK